MKTVPVVVALVMLSVVAAVAIVVGLGDSPPRRLATVVGVGVWSGAAGAAASLLAYPAGRFGFRLAVAVGMLLLVAWLTTFVSITPMRQWLFAYVGWSVMALLGTSLVRLFTIDPARPPTARFSLSQILLVMIALAMVMGLTELPGRGRVDLSMVVFVAWISLSVFLNAIVATGAALWRTDWWILLVLIVPLIAAWLPLTEPLLHGAAALLFAYPHMVILFVVSSWWSHSVFNDRQRASPIPTDSKQDPGIVTVDEVR